MPYLNRSISKEVLGVEAAAAGNTQRAQQLWRSAADDCSKAIELDPKEFAAWFDRRAACVAAGYPLPAACACSQSALPLHGSRHTHTLSLSRRRGNIDMRLGDYQQALQDFQTAADLAPGLAGEVLRQAGKKTGIGRFFLRVWDECKGLPLAHRCDQELTAES